MENFSQLPVGGNLRRPERLTLSIVTLLHNVIAFRAEKGTDGRKIQLFSRDS